MKLKKEAKELSAANIISSETGKSRDGETTHLLPIMAQDRCLFAFTLNEPYKALDKRNEDDYLNFSSLR